VQLVVSLYGGVGAGRLERRPRAAVDAMRMRCWWAVGAACSLLLARFLQFVLSLYQRSCDSGLGGALHVAVEACRAFGSVTVASIRCWWAAGVLCMMLLERAVQLVLFLYQVNVDGAGGLAGCST